MANYHSLHEKLTAWRRDLHQHPEFGFEESRTSAFVASKLREFGIEVAEGIGGTGVVGTLKRGTSNRAIALRADMDALRISETSGADWSSQNPGIMHACGHDGHTTMLLGAAKLLAEEGGFDGTVRFLFQPAEEWGKGALAMLDDGLMERFPFEEIYGIHTMPGVPIGVLQTKAGPMRSAEDNFEIILRGVGGHAARPHWGNEVLVAACAIVTNLQTIVSRRINPIDVAVVSVTNLVTDGTRNALPGLARISGDARSFKDSVSELIERQMRLIAEATAAAYNVSAEMTYTRDFVPLINDAGLVEEMLAAARSFLPNENVKVLDEAPTGSEDFAQFLQHVPGCFVNLGNGENSAPLHNPSFDYNDEGLIFGVKTHAAIVRRRLPLDTVKNR